MGKPQESVPFARSKLVKLADKIANLRDIVASPPSNWSLERKREYFDWGKRVIDEIRGANAKLERRFISYIGSDRRSEELQES